MHEKNNVKFKQTRKAAKKSTVPKNIFAFFWPKKNRIIENQESVALQLYFSFIL